MATARELKSTLNNLTENQLDVPLSMPGYYGEHYEVELPSLVKAQESAFSSTKILVLAFPKVYFGPEPD